MFDSVFLVFFFFNFPFVDVLGVGAGVGGDNRITWSSSSGFFLTLKKNTVMQHSIYSARALVFVRNARDTDQSIRQHQVVDGLLIEYLIHNLKQSHVQNNH